MIDLDQQRDPLINSRVRDGGDFRAGRASGRRRVLYVHKAADGDAMRERGARSAKAAAQRPVPLGGEAVPPGFKAEALAALGLRPEDAISEVR